VFRVMRSEGVKSPADWTGRRRQFGGARYLHMKFAGHWIRLNESVGGGVVFEGVVRGKSDCHATGYRKRLHS